MVTPPCLGPGASVAIVSPASATDPTLIDGAAERLRAEGFNPLLMPHAKGVSGSFSAPAESRLADLQGAIDNSAVGAILCSRGGYGAAGLLPHIRLRRPVWLIGFSDISALHGLWHSREIRSIHGSMAKELALGRCPGDDANRRLFHILRTGEMPPVEFVAASGSKPGVATGRLVGGNLAVLDGLAATPFDLLLPDSILVVEDVSEPIYKVERMFMRLRMAGILGRLRGLIVGQFTGWQPSKDWENMYDMLAQFAADVPGPVAFGAPFGHVDFNLPFVEGWEATLCVNDGIATVF